MATSLVTAIAGETGGQPRGIVAYDNTAKVVERSQLVALDYDDLYGANLHHGLHVARELLSNANGTRRMLIIADAEPSSHGWDITGGAFLQYPPAPQTTQATLEEAHACAADGIRADFLLLRDESPIRPLALELAGICGGLARAVEANRPHSEVVRSFLSTIGLS